MSVPPPAAPNHILRLHSHPINALAFSPDNERIYSGDTAGLVVITSTRSLRAITKWQAHSDGLLGIEEWGERVITHGRDNKLHVWNRITEIPESARLGDTAACLGNPAPGLSFSLDVNALNYCRFSLMCLRAKASEKNHALIAVPGLIDSSVADIWTLPSGNRIHAAIGREVQKSIFSPAAPKNRNSSGIIMNLHLYSPNQSAGAGHDGLHLLCAYENGSITLRKYTCIEESSSVEGKGWEAIWTTKLHAETIMAMKVSFQNDFAISVSVDHLICRYDLKVPCASTNNSGVAYKTKVPGNSSVAIRDDGKVCAIGGWDGSIRIYSTRTLKPLGTLRFHKSTCQVVEFAKSSTDGGQSNPQPKSETEDEDDGMTSEEKVERDRWLVGGGRDCRLSIWPLISFSKP